MVGGISVLFGAAVLVLVKHALPVLDMSRPPREWVLSAQGELQSKQLSTTRRGESWAKNPVSTHSTVFPLQSAPNRIGP